jgi:hypothetical protein
MDEVKIVEAHAAPSQVRDIGGAATVDVGTGGAETFAVLSAGKRETLRMTLAAAHPNAIPELITGETVGEMVASLETAKAAYQRTIEAAKMAAPVAAGGGGRPVGVDLSKLSPLAKISIGLKER